MHLFGLTGGIASGKSAVSSHLRARGVPVIDADLLARDAVAPGTPGLRAIEEAFGSDVIDGGALDRKRLAARVFEDPAARARLNAIVHPIVSRLTFERAAALRDEGHPLACYDAALIVENGVADAFRPLVVVSAPEALQIARAVARDGGDEASARARVRAQMPLAEKVRLADFVIDNTGTLTQLAQRTDVALAGVCAKLGVDANRYLAGAILGGEGPPRGA